MTGTAKLKITAFSWILVLCAMILAGCAEQQPQRLQEPTTTAATVPTVTVRFLARGEEVARQVVDLGTNPQDVEPEIMGAVFAGWQDDHGQMVVPQQIPVEGDTVYTAILYPALSRHVPYLFPDENGFIWPDAPLLADDFAEAVQTLAEEGAQRYFPGIPAGPVEMTVSELRSILDGFFPEEDVAALFEGAEDGIVTRGQFAQVMNRLLGRGQEETVVLVADTALPMDLGADRGDYADVLEAALDHTQDETGQDWANAVLDCPRETGFFNLGGWLYYADETGCIVRDTQVGDLAFGPDGRYTCGDGELDALVAEILDGIIVNNPGMERLDLLRKAFEYSRDSFTYLRKDPMPFGATGWEIDYAKTMLTGGYGNCYNYAAVFWALARGLGYEAKAISGTMTLTDQPHSWVEIVMDGQPYIFDPEEEMYYNTQRNIFDRDMFMVTYAEGTFWNYKRAG